MFARGAKSGKVKTWCYDEDAEDFTKGMLNIILFIFISISECHNVPRCDCTGYLGFRSFESTIEERDDRSGFGFSTSFRAGDILPSLARTRHYRAFLQASLQGTVLMFFFSLSKNGNKIFILLYFRNTWKILDSSITSSVRQKS